MLGRFTTRLAPALSVGAALGLALTLPARPAEACGCFAPPDPSVPIVQAGEQIVFSHDDGEVTAHIQIQYEGAAEEFGWILPLPSVPEMELGTDELFAQLIQTTQPRYRLNRVFEDQCSQVPFASGAANDAAGRGNNAESDGNDVVVLQDSIGPFDFAVLRGDTREEMFEWLTENDYFIPTGTEDVVGPYIHEGAYFLALKLQKGNDVGDIQPIVLRYASDLPMIPIILTQVAANPDMGIRVWVLGDERAIPRNYRHTIINEEYIDWFNNGQNYNDVIVNATNEAPDGQSFVTEFAGDTDRMQRVLDWEGRFGNQSDFLETTDPGLYVQNMRAAGFPWSSNVVSILKANIPYPEGLERVVDEDEFYNNVDYYLTYYREENPLYFEGYEFEFDNVGMTTSLWDRVVVPTLAAGKLFRDNPKMTRMYTTLSPEEMTKDPTFSFNPSLPDVSNEHVADFIVQCDGDTVTNKGILQLPDGRRFFVEDPTLWTERERAGVPYSRRIELLREEGAPTVEVDNSTRVSGSDAGGGGCVCVAEDADEGFGASALALGALGLVLFARRRRR